MGIPLDTVRATRSALSKLVNKCKALPNFDTLQIVHFSLTKPPPINHPRRRGGQKSYPKQQKPALVDQVRGVKDWAIDCLKKPETGNQGGAGREKTAVMLRVIELIPVLALPRPRASTPLRFNLDSVKVEEYRV